MRGFNIKHKLPSQVDKYPLVNKSFIFVIKITKDNYIGNLISSKKRCISISTKIFTALVEFLKQEIAKSIY